MKTISKLALAAILTAGVSAPALVSPAIAKDKKAEAEKPGLKLSPEVLKVAQPTQAALTAKDIATATPLVPQVEAAAKTDDDKYIAAVFRYQLEALKLSAQQEANPNAPVNETVLAGPLDALISNPSTPAADKGRFAYRRGALAFNGKQYAQALQYFQQAQQLGYTDDNLPLQMVTARINSGDTAGGLADLTKYVDAQKAAGKPVPEDYYRFGIAKANAAKNAPETMAWLKRYVAAYPTAKNWRDVIVTYGLQQQSVAKLDSPQKIDLFRLMHATHALADQTDYLEYAQRTFDRGLPAETQAVVKEGIAAGKIPAANSAAKEYLTLSARAIANDAPMATLEKQANAAATGKLAAQTGDALLGQGQYARAVTLYRAALQKGGIDANEVNTHLGIALAQSGDKAGAATAFKAVTGAPRADIANLWLAYVEGPTAS